LYCQLINQNFNKFPPEFKNDAKNIAIDFDGVIHDDNLGYHDGTCYGKPIEGSLESIIELSKAYRIIVFTAKAKPSRPLIDGKTGKQLVEEWLQINGYSPFIYEVTAEKPRACLYIDDNGYRFENWSRTMNYVKGNDENFKP
jgi:hypothetical protein